MSRFTLSRRSFLHLAAGAVPFAIWPATVWSSAASAVTPAANVCRINALLPALEGIASRTEGELGVAVIDLAGGASCAVRATRLFRCTAWSS